MTPQMFDPTAPVSPAPMMPAPVPTGASGLGAGPLPVDPDPNQKVMDRDQPTPEESRRVQIELWQSRVTDARSYWETNAFTQMRKDMKIARGDQWAVKDDYFADDPGQRYVANIVLRHIHQRTASIYGKNPKIVARRKERLMSTIWDGNPASAMAAVQGLGDPLQAESSLALLMDAKQTIDNDQMMDKLAKTLELLYEHEINEQPVPFKQQMKATIRRTLTTGVGWVKLGFTRVMKLSPEIESQIAGMSQQLATVERISADIADDMITEDSAEAATLKQMIATLQNKTDVLVSEGLKVSYPDSTAIIPDRQCKQLRGFVGAEWVAEQYMLSADRIKEVYKKDVLEGGRAYSEDPATRTFRAEQGTPIPDPHSTRKVSETSLFCVWEIYSKIDGQVFVICDGYGDYLLEPAEPDVWLERFWPWFAFVTNEVYDEVTVYPPSDVSLLTDIQHEVNRARQGLREHRRANRPRTFTRTGALEADDKDAIKNAKANAVIELNGLPEAMPIEDALMAWQGPAIDPNLYDTTPALEDFYRVIGAQEANLGGTSGATATETSIAEGSRMSSVGSIVDDLDGFLTEFARAAGQVLLGEVAAETVKKIVGPGAIWPELDREDIAREIYLDVEAASTGRPNQAQEIQNAQQLIPLLLQVPGISPEWIARELIRRLDDRMDIKDAFAAGAPSIQMMNSLKSITGGPPGADPNKQGPAGANNTQSTEPPQANATPRPPDAPPAAAPIPPV